MQISFETILVFFIVLVIIWLQIYFFSKNKQRMQEFQEVFEQSGSWRVTKDIETGFVNGIDGRGNGVFLAIKESINKYLGSNSGSVIEFGLLKDAVDRHCDGVENDIESLTPVPLYCGLAGTMAGVIIGLLSLIFTGSISALLGKSQTGAEIAQTVASAANAASTSTDFNAAATGVNDLLTGVALAMVASICGIGLTTWGSLRFKKCKQKAESGKNTFLAWLQGRLLPELPSDTSSALNQLVVNLNRFNSDFQTNLQRFNAAFMQNTAKLDQTLAKVTEAVDTMGETAELLRDLDVMKMARANVLVLKDLQNCTDKFERFNEYLDSVDGYTVAIHRFTKQFEEESNRLHVLEEIRDFFTRHKGEISQSVADSDKAINDALRVIKDHAVANSRELNTTLVEQAEAFKKILTEERDSFDRVNRELQEKFSVELGQMPMLKQKLETVASVPEKIEKLIKAIESAEGKIRNDVKLATNQLVGVAKNIKSSGNGPGIGENVTVNGGTFSIPNWIQWGIAIVVITCIGNTLYNVWGVYDLPTWFKYTMMTVGFIVTIAILAACTVSTLFKGGAETEEESEDVAMPAVQTVPAPATKAPAKSAPKHQKKAKSSEDSARKDVAVAQAEETKTMVANDKQKQ